MRSGVKLDKNFLKKFDEHLKERGIDLRNFAFEEDIKYNTLLKALNEGRASVPLKIALDQIINLQNEFSTAIKINGYYIITNGKDIITNIDQLKNGRINDQLIWNRELSSEELKQTEEYLQSKQD